MKNEYINFLFVERMECKYGIMRIHNDRKFFRENFYHDVVFWLNHSKNKSIQAEVFNNECDISIIIKGLNRDDDYFSAYIEEYKKQKQQKNNPTMNTRILFRSLIT